jgi:membrane-associated phospholipid phosphatase
MNAFDLAIQTWLVHFGSSSFVFTHVIHAIVDFYLVKGVVPLAILCAIWFKPGDSQQWRREMVVASVCAGLVAFLFGRLSALALPFRLRPIYDPNLHLMFPLSSEMGTGMRFWSSFPSDHAAIWMAMSVGIFFVWRWSGVFAIVQCVLLVCFPRVYLGLHYPSDVIAGAAIGALCAWLLTRAPIRTRFAPVFVRFMDVRPTLAYMLAFLFTFELATMFDEPRLFAGLVIKHLHH